MTKSFVDAYLERLGVVSHAAADLAYLRELNLAHLQRIPFENLSIHLREPLDLQPEALADKILRRGRGGFCYELNGLFSILLEQLGYEVTLFGARVMDDGAFGPPLDHLVLAVGFPGTREGEAGSSTGFQSDSAVSGKWIVDVGFGDHSVHPLPWVEDVDHDDRGGVFRLERLEAGGWDLYRNGVIQYRIEDANRMLSDFDAMCWYHQTSPKSHFTRSLVCSRLTDGGRVTLTGRRLITTSAGAREETEITGDDELLATYRDIFGIELEQVPAGPGESGH